MKLIFKIAFFALLFAACNSSQKSNAQTETPPPAEVIAPNVPVYDSFDDMAYIFNQKNDTTYVINFWATWCKPCVEELPYFEEIHEKYAAKPVKVILVSLDFKKQIEKKLLPFIKDRNLQPEVIALVDSDANTWISKVDDVWDGAIPVTIIYNSKKREFIGRQFVNHGELETIVKSFYKNFQRPSRLSPRNGLIS